MRSAATAQEQEKSRLLRLQAELFEENGVSLGSYLTEGEDRLIIGSSKRADLVVPHESVSHIHAMLRIVEGKEILLYDLGSEQGTYVEGKKIVEKQLNPGEIFEIGGHRVKVNLVDHAKDEMGTEKALFWKADGEKYAPDFLEMIRLEEGIVREERTLARNGRIVVGRRKSEVLLDGIKGGETFLHRKDSGSAHGVNCLLPPGFQAEIYDKNNELVRVIEQEGSGFTFNESEKARLSSKDGKSEILVFWRPEGVRASRRGRDADNPALQRSMILCACAAAILLAIVSYVPLKAEKNEEATIPKTSYFRLSMGSQAAPAETAAPEAAPGPAAPTKASKAPVSKAASISSSLSKLLNKKSTLTAESIQQAISTNGKVTTRVGNLKSGLKSAAISAGSLGGGSVNVNAISAGLSAGGGGKAGALKGFAGGKGAGIGSGSGFRGKGFDMSLGGDEAEAIGGLDKSLIAAVVQANLGQIKHCYERQLIVDPNIFGKVVAQWTINKDGVVSSSSVKNTTMNNKAVENCIVSRIKSWGFPKPKGGGQVLVSYPFLFKSLN
jgi:hypothetical protein